MATSIEVRNLKKYYGSVKAVDGISFSVGAGTIFGMLGPNGAGKTTTIETIIGLLDKTDGEIDVLGLDPDGDREELKKRIGVQLQNPSLFPRLTVRETINLFASFYPQPLSAEEAIDRVGLSESEGKRVESLSGGQRHRLAVALAMVSNGEIVFLDEPTTGLDPQARRRLWEVIRDLKEEGVTVFLTTHYMDEAQTLCGKLVIIDRGKIIAQGSPGYLIDKYFQERAVEFPDPGLNEEEKKALEGADLSKRVSYEEGDGMEGNLVILYSEDVTETISKAMDFGREVGKPIDGLTVRQPTLEDVFLKLTGRRIRE